MINSKVKLISGFNGATFETLMNRFMMSIDIRQVVKTEFGCSKSDGSETLYAVIYYVNIEDIRDAKIDSLLETK